ncbi:MAG: peptidoglycan-binding protein [Pseudomonadota bacterium]
MHIAKAMRKLVRTVPSESVAAFETIKFENDLRAAHFIGQLAHESNFKPVSENLNYSASALRRVFGKYYPTNAAAQQAARKPMEIANKVYGGRMGNRKGTSDGWNFRGRGFIQITGRNNYTAAKKAIGVDIIKEPDLALNPDIATKIALWYFDMRNIWPHCDANNVDRVTKLINGGFNGLADRRKKTKIALQVLNGQPEPLSTVRYGSRGADAQLLQSALNEMGFGPIVADGIFGQRSVAALRKMQAAWNLAVDGICGRNTWKMIAERGEAA